MQLSKRILTISAALAIGFAAAVSPAGAAAGAHRVRAEHRYASQGNTPPDSYLQYRVYTVDQLIQQVETNPVVRARFARTFQVPQSRVVSYMQNNLVESYIPVTKRYTVYCVRPSGKFYAIHQTFRRGTRVFSLRNGEPVMKWICGNPLAHYLPSVEVISERPATPVIHVAHSIQELTPSEMQHVIVPAEIPSPTIQPMIPVHFASGSSPFSAGAGAAAVLGAALITVGSTGHHSNIPPLTPVVPEAPPLAYILLAVPGLWFLARRRLAHKTE